MTPIGTLSNEDADRLAKRLVANHPFPGASHAALESLLSRGEVRHLQIGEALCKEGDSGDEMWFLLRGTILVQRKDRSGIQRNLSEVQAPALIGHMGVIDRSPRSASCMAETDVELVALDTNTYEQILAESTVSGSALRRLLLSSLCGQLTQANEQIRLLVEELTEDKSEPAPKEPPSREATREQARKSTENSVARLTAKLGGWELEEMEKELELVIDEDQRRRVSKNPHR